MKMSKRTIFWVAAALCLVGLCGEVRGGTDKTFVGEIADTQCALNVHSLSQSHKEMIAMKSAGKTEADCARFCVKERGGRFVLQAKGKVYRLDNQDLAERSAGLKVKVIGVLDLETETITVRSIQVLTPSPAPPVAAK